MSDTAPAMFGKDPQYPATAEAPTPTIYRDCDRDHTWSFKTVYAMVALAVITGWLLGYAFGMYQNNDIASAPASAPAPASSSTTDWQDAEYTEIEQPVLFGSDYTAVEFLNMWDYEISLDGFYHKEFGYLDFLHYDAALDEFWAVYRPVDDDSNSILFRDSTGQPAYDDVDTEQVCVSTTPPTVIGTAPKNATVIMTCRGE